MTAPTIQQPIVPPRPSKSPARDLLAGPIPAIPPRPVNKRIDRSRSPNPERFAQSPFNGGIVIKSANASPNGSSDESGDAIGRSGSVPMPSVGEEGMEYSAVTQELKPDQETSLPEQTRTVGEDLKLHSPMPSLPAESAKQRVMNVTRTNSDKAASFGIGKPGYPEERAVSRERLRRKPSTTFSTTSEQAHYTDDEHGIPEIGQRVPMNPHLGDVQAPSPAPVPENSHKNHNRKHSSRGLPPGSYGMHGHGVAPQDELDKAYYKKHPELLQKEKHHTPLRDRQNDFAMSSNDLNKLVRDTASRASTLGSAEHRGMPHEEVGFLASEEYATRVTSSRPASVVGGVSLLENPDPIHIDDSKRPEHYSYGAAEETAVENVEEYNAPILASDEVEKDPKVRVQRPAIRPNLERNDSSYDGSRPVSRPPSRPTSVYNAGPTIEFGYTPLEDVREYEPLFPEEAAKKEQEKRGRTEEPKARHYFPSKDVWEDAPTSVHYTAEVSTPDTAEETSEEPRRKSSTHYENRPITPAQAFAMQQEALAEKEANGRKHNFLPIFEDKSTWVGHKAQKGGKSGGHRFPSRDVWEDTPESLLHETEVSEPLKDDSKPEVPFRPAKKSAELLQRPVIPERPKSRQGNGGDAVAKQPLLESDKPKPPVPIRPVKKVSEDSKDGELSKLKPQIPSRPVGGKIAALQAGFMSDLNKRLQLGPQGPKKEEPEHEEEKEEKEKAPLSDARKGRARGPQRRAPTKSPHPVPTAASESSSRESSVLTLALSLPQSIWNINPEDGDFVVASHSYESPPKEAPTAELESELQQTTESEKPVESEEAPKTEVEEESPREPEPLIKLGEAEEPKGLEVTKEVEDIKEPEVIKESEAIMEPELPKEPEVIKEIEIPKESEPEVSETPEGTKDNEVPKDSKEPVKEETLVGNAGGASVLEAKVEKGDDKDIEPVEVKEEVKA